MEAQQLAVDDQGYVYVLSNPAFKQNLLKIGRTVRTANARAWEIYSGATGVPAPFEVEYTHAVSNCPVAEQKIHARLSNYRYSEHREFFEIPLEFAKMIVAEIGDQINEQYGAPTIPEIAADEWSVVTPEESVTESKPTLVVRTRKNGSTASDNLTTKTRDQNIEDYFPGLGEQNQNASKSYNFVDKHDDFSYRRNFDWERWIIIFVVGGLGGIGNISLGISGYQATGSLYALFFLLMGIVCAIVALVKLLD